MNEIEHKTDGDKKGFFVEGDDEVIAEMTYGRRGDDKIILDHTWVDDSLRGQGVARKLLDRALAFAREQELKVIPECSYVKGQMQKHEELRDVLDPSFNF